MCVYVCVVCVCVCVCKCGKTVQTLVEASNPVIIASHSDGLRRNHAGSVLPRVGGALVVINTPHVLVKPGVAVVYDRA
jgi:hypothetical protein